MSARGARPTPRPGLGDDGNETRTNRPSPATDAETRYKHFCQILAVNDGMLTLFANIEDMAMGRIRRDMEIMARQIRHAAENAAAMIAHLNLMTAHRFAELEPTLHRIRNQIESMLPPDREGIAVPLIVPLENARMDQAHLIGGKSARLGEVWWHVVGAEVPLGFVITTAAFAHVMSHNDLWPRVDRISAAQRAGDRDGMAMAVDDLSNAMEALVLPDHVVRAIDDAYLQLMGEVMEAEETLLAVRSSAVEEDSEVSHAGQYHTELFVDRAGLLAAYRKVIASTFSARGIAYRVEHGLGVADVMMAVLCMRMLRPRLSGVLFTRNFQNPAVDQLLLSATTGPASGVVSGEASAIDLVTDDRGNVIEGNPDFPPNDLKSLIRVGRLLEKRFDGPQDIEWAFDPHGTLNILQSRPMIFVEAPDRAPLRIGDGRTPLLYTGLCACPGAAAGLVVHCTSEADLGGMPEGRVIVARHSAPMLSAVMPRAAAIVTEVGSPTGHMSILAREFNVPCIVNAAQALTLLTPGREVTVDAWRCRVFEGILDVGERRAYQGRQARHDKVFADEIVNRILGLVTPLSLTDPLSREFRPDKCRSLHDITRFVHEKTFGAVFDLNEYAEREKQHAVELGERLPFKLLIRDVGGGLTGDTGTGGPLMKEHVQSIPLRAFLGGLLDDRIRWNVPRPVSSSGFLSVVGESITGPPPEVQQIGRISYAVVSDHYMNFHTKAGYHFSTVDTYCGPLLNQNYIHFRFAGGGAGVERRARRIAFLIAVLEALDFQCRQRDDIIWARLEKWDNETICHRLRLLGQLTMVTRQMDMLMDSDTSPLFFAQAFLEDKMALF